MINRNQSARNGRACYSWSSRLYRPIYTLVSRYFPKRERSNYNSTQGTPEESLDRELDLSAKRRSLWSAGGLLAPWIYGLFHRRSIYTRVRSWPSLVGKIGLIKSTHEAWKFTGRMLEASLRVCSKNINKIHSMHQRSKPGLRNTFGGHWISCLLAHGNNDYDETLPGHNKREDILSKGDKWPRGCKARRQITWNDLLLT